jgi:molybdopterin-binding protein
VGGDVVSELEVDTASGLITSVITTCSIKELALIGSEVLALVKATDVAIAKL